MTGDLIISGVILAAGLSYLAYAAVIVWGTRSNVAPRRQNFNGGRRK